jgi:hypothetical protein
MKTGDSIEEQSERKAARGDGAQSDKKHRNHDSQNTVPVSVGRQRQLAALKPWPKGVSGNPACRPKTDHAAEMARACFEENWDALKVAFTKALLRGNAYAFKELADRAYGKLKERQRSSV